jgi:hypothetical protein
MRPRRIYRPPFPRLKGDEMWVRRVGLNFVNMDAPRQTHSSGFLPVFH